MRKRLWLQFHFWTIGVVLLLLVANVASVFRPFATEKNAVSASAREPASVAQKTSVLGLDSRLALKTTEVGCEPKLRLRVVESVRQIRLQFSSCAQGDKIVGIRNATNDFEATIFGGASSEVEEETAMAGTFKSAGESALPKPRKPAAERNPQPESENISTDYISLSAGENEIKIRRSGREQILKVERR